MRLVETVLFRRIRLPVLLAFAIAALDGYQASSAAEDAKRPNVLIIVADDLGYADLGFQGGKDVPTPHLDGLAHGGTRCTNGYVSCPVCSPTRAGLLTGRYQQRFGHEFNPGPQQNETREYFGLPLTETTIANQLKKAGYRTGQVGKWHLGFSKRFLPSERGFDESFGFLGGAHTYLPAAEGKKSGIFRNGEEIHETEYLTDAFAREGVSFIERNAPNPFFLYLTFNAVHAPLDTRPDKLKQFKHITDPKRRSYAAMLSSLDDAVGRVLGQLDKSGVTQNTLVFFISDNGGPTQANASLNTPLNGVKATVWEGGIRVPYILRWPGRIAADKTYEEPVIALDNFATVSAVAGVEVPKDRVIDGVNLLPYLKGEVTTAPHVALYWRFGPQHAIRKGQYKLLKLRNGEEHLFDLKQDIGEQHDLLTERAEVAAELRAEFAKWDSQLAKPLWGPQGNAAAQ